MRQYLMVKGMTDALKLETAIEKCWQNTTETVLDGIAELYTLTTRMVDIRAAQPVLVVQLDHPEPEVKKAVLELIGLRAEMGADIGMAVPALATLLVSSDGEIRSLSASAISFADMRMPGISKRIGAHFEGKLDVSLSDLNVAERRGGFAIGAWGSDPLDSAGAADFFGRLFAGCDVDKQFVGLFSSENDKYCEIRAAAYVLQTIGYSHVWPGNRNKLRQLLIEAIGKLNGMIAVETHESFLLLWHDEPDVVGSVKEQILALEQRLSQLVS